MRRKNFFGNEFNGLPLYQPQAGYEGKASQGFNYAILHRCKALLDNAFTKSQRILAVEITLNYPTGIDTSRIGNECISDFTTHYCRVLREQRNVSVDFLQASELAPRTGRRHHHVIFLIGGDWWHFVDYRTVRELWRQALERCLGWTDTAADVPLYITNNWNGEGAAVYGFPVDAARPEQVAELFRRMSYLAKNYGKDYGSRNMRSFTSSELQ